MHRNFNFVETHCCASKKVDKTETHAMRLYINIDIVQLQTDVNYQSPSGDGSYPVTCL